MTRLSFVEKGTGSNLLSRASFLDSSTFLTSAQIQMDGMLHGFSEGASDWRSLVAMTAGGLAYRATKLGVMSAPYAGPLLARLSAPVLGLASEVTTFRLVGAGLPRPGSGNPTPRVFGKEFLTDFVNFASLKIFGLASRNTNPILSHTLQDVGMVAGHQVAYGLNLATRPEGNLFEQLVHAEITNLQMQAGMSLGAMLTGYRLSQIERFQELQTRSIVFRQSLPFISKTSQLPIMAENSTGMIFRDPIAALAKPRDFSPYRMAEEIEIAREGDFQLLGRIGERLLAEDGVRYTMNYYLNGKYVGYLTHQVIPETKTLRLIDMKISAQMQGQNLGKVIMLYHLYQAHVAGWQFMRDLITNQKLVQTANRPFQDGLNMYLSDAQLWMLCMTMDPYEPGMEVREPAHRLYETDTSTWRTNAYVAYRITGTPNPALFKRQEDSSSDY